MRVIRCDLCNKELKENELHIRYGEDRTYDFCKECEEIYEKCDSEVANKRKEIKARYEKELKEETEKIFIKYKIKGDGYEEKGV